MSKKKENYAQIASAIGFSFDEVTESIYGEKGGFRFLLTIGNSNYPYMFTITTSGYSSSYTIEKHNAKALTKSVKGLQSVTQKDSVITAVIANTKNIEKVITYLTDSLNAIVAFLLEKGIVPICQTCKVNTPTSTYAVGNAYFHLCPQCADAIKRNAEINQQNENNKNENIIGGIVGAFLGSLIGAAVIVIISQLGRVAAISGVLMAVCTLKGYALFGHKLTKKGIVISALIMLGMTYVGNNVDWAIFIAKEAELNFFDAYQCIGYLLEEGYLENYYTNLIMLLLFTALGAIPMAISTVRSYKNANRVVQIGYSSTNDDSYVA